MLGMRRNLLRLAGVGACLFGLATASAAADVVEVGVTPTKVIAPSCPKGASASQCTIILTQVTALETLRDAKAYPTTIRKAGEIVAWTVGLSRLASSRTTALKDIRYLDHTYGGTTQAAITVLAPVGKRRKFGWKVVAEGPIVHLQPYLGYVVQFPLATPLQVVPGDVVALTVPTWAPVLSIDLAPGQFAYRQSRRANCSNPPGVNQAELTVGATAQYGCDYPGTRVEYSAIEITNPVKPKNYVH